MAVIHLAGRRRHKRKTRKNVKEEGEEKGEDELTMTIGFDVQWSFVFKDPIHDFNFGLLKYVKSFMFRCEVHCMG